MQRMLVGLVLFLTLALGAMALVTFNLQERVDATARSRRESSATRRVVDPGASQAELQKLERRIAGLLTEIKTLRKQQRANAAALARRAARNPVREGEGARIPSSDPVRLGDTARRAGSIAVTEADEAFYLAVKASVDRKRRIRGMADNTMRRIDRLVKGGTIQAIPEAERGKVEKIVLRFVTAADDLLGRYIRKPSADLQAMPGEQRREALRTERDTIVEEAQRALSAVLGAEDAGRVADRTLKTNRYRGRDPNGRFRRRNIR